MALSLLIAVGLVDCAIAQSSPPSPQKASSPQVQKSSKPPKAPPRKSRRSGRSTRPAAKPQVEEKPEVAPPPEDETLAAGLARLNRIKEKDLTAADSARRTALEWFLAVSSKDARRAAKVLDVVGYQPLPIRDDLPESPGKPLSATQLENALAAARAISIHDLRMDRIAILDRAALSAYPALAAWTLPQEDYVVALHLPELGDASADYFVVVRERARRGTVVAGTALPISLGPQVAENDR